MRIPSFRTYPSVVLFTLCAAGLASCGQSPTGREAATPAARPPTLAPLKDDVLLSIEVKSRQLLPQPVSPWREEESRLFADVLRADPADILIIPFEVQDRAFDGIERSLMTEILPMLLRGTRSCR
jgi:flagellar basal body L-ring protein FlgH